MNKKNQTKSYEVLMKVVEGLRKGRGNGAWKNFGRGVCLCIFTEGVGGCDEW